MTASTQKTDRQFNHFSSTKYIIGSLVLGILFGLLIGEPAGKLQLLGTIYIGLLQMTVLPYIMFALIANIGRLNYFEAKLLTRQGFLVLLSLWLIGIFSVWAMGMALPRTDNGAFFSSLLIDSPAKINFLQLFIPANIFQSLTDNAVPAVVLFSMMFGTACIGYKEQKPLLEYCDHVTKILLRVNSFVVMLTPIGIFGIAASSAGTLTLDQFGRVQAYVLMLIASVLLVTVAVMPLFISSCTPFSYRQIFRESRNALITVFVVGSVFVVIPLLITGVNRLFHQHVTTKSQHARIPDLVLPLAYPFPDMGKLLSLVFVAFAAWFYDKPLEFLDYPEMLLVGLFLNFGKLITSIPFLLDLYHIPDDIFNLFITVGVICGRAADVAGAMHLMTFTILTTALMTGSFKIKWPTLIRNGLISFLLYLCVGLAIRTFLHQQHSAVPAQPQILQMQLLNQRIPHTVSSLSFSNAYTLKPGQHIINRIRQNKVIRIGIHEENLPFSFYNTSGQLVGFDIDLMMSLAEDLQVAIEFIPYESGYLLQQLEEDHFDIAVSGITPNPGLLASTRILYSTSYLDTHLALVVPDYKQKQFSDFQQINQLKNVRAAVRKDSNFADRINSLLPGVKVTEMDSVADFFNNPEFHDEILFTTAEGGSAWTLINPEYDVVTPFSEHQGAPLVIAIGGEDLMLEHFISTWIKLKQSDGTIDTLFKYWIQGKIPTHKEPRWSILNYLSAQDN
ncbi:cation:dicarboxylate symporter family transporter [Methyloprofundus sp.]|uniref:cation:dicarboxylate symporter family transporter n=1 Tax=Methyloprofundus sp. TaxID=2020875 RepID=UPI003D0BB3D7